MGYNNQFICLVGGHECKTATVCGIPYTRLTDWPPVAQLNYVVLDEFDIILYHLEMCGYSAAERRRTTRTKGRFQLHVKTKVVLTSKEQSFVLAPAHGNRPTRAPTLAGYAVASARNLLRKPHIRAALRAVHNNTAAVADRIEAAEEREAGHG